MKMKQTLLLIVLLLTSAPLFAASPKIIGGTSANEGSWPWMIALLEADKANLLDAQYCGGALIAANWVLTAGHCVWNYSGEDVPLALRRPSEMQVLVGAHDLDSFSGIRRSVKTVVPHPDFNPATLDHDIALLELNHDTVNTTLPIYSGLSKESVIEGLVGETATLIGWGRDQVSSNHYPSVLQQINLPIVAQLQCSDTFSNIDILEEAEICAGIADTGKGGCAGDSGGPLMMEIDGGWVQVGLVSRGADCSLNGKVGIYTRTSSYVDFIESHVEGVQFTSGQEEEQPFTPGNVAPILQLLLPTPEPDDINIGFPIPEYPPAPGL